MKNLEEQQRIDQVDKDIESTRNALADKKAGELKMFEMLIEVGASEEKITKLRNLINKNQEQPEESGTTGVVDNQISKVDFDDFVRNNKKGVVEDEGLDKVKINSIDKKENEEKDENYEKAKEIVLSSKNTSPSHLQRKLKIGWNAAKRLLAELEKEGIVGPDNGAMNREFLGDKKEEIKSTTVEEDENVKTVELENSNKEGNNEDVLIRLLDDDENTQISPEKMRTLEEVLAEAEEKRALQLESSKFKNGIIKGLDKWENFGQGEEGWKGFGKRFTKTAINLALIGAISSVSVEKLAEAGIGSVTALGGGVSSYVGRKIATGLGLGAIMEMSDKKIPDKIKKWMPEIMAGVGLGVVALSGVGVAVAGASVLGYLSSKFIKGRFTNEKIINKQEKATQKFISKYENKNGEVDLNKLDEIEIGYQKLLKKYENMRIWGKLLDGAGKLGMASVISGLTLEASGLVRDNIHNTNTESGSDSSSKENTTEADSTSVKPEVKDSIVSKNDTIAEVKVEPKDSIAVNDSTSHVASADDQNKIEDNSNNPEVKQEIDEKVFVHKGEGLTHTFVRQIENNNDLAKELGYKGDLNDSKALHEFAREQAPVIAEKVGYIDADGSEVRVSEGAYELKTENGHIIVNERNIDGSLIETHHEGDKFETNIEKGEYIKGGDLSKANSASNEFKVPEQVDPSSNKIDVISYTNEAKLHDLNISDQANASEDIFKMSQEISLLENTPHNTVEYQNLHNHIIEMQKDITKNYGDILNIDKINSDMSNIDQGVSNIHNTLSSEQLIKIEEVGKSNINHIFYEKNELWNSISKNVSADRFFELSTDGLKPEYQSLFSYMDKLQEISGLNPVPESLVSDAESIPHYINRALEKIEQIGMLDKVKL